MKPIGRNTFPDFPDMASGRLGDTAGTPSFPSPATFLSVPGYLPFRGRAERRPSPDGKEGREMSGFRRENLVAVVKFFRDCNCIVT